MNVVPTAKRLGRYAAAAHIARGMEDNAYLPDALEHWDAGDYELTVLAVYYTDYICALWKAGSKVCENGGVYDYEVSRPFGTWLIDQIVSACAPAQAPDHNECCAYLRRMAHGFFARGQLGPTADNLLTHALDKVTMPEAPQV